PHPARKPDATRRPLPAIDPRKLFQSSSGPKAGCHGMGTAGCLDSDSGFNPHPARKPDATEQATALHSRMAGFNPHPARKPDATHHAEAEQHEHNVSILIRPESRMPRVWERHDTARHVVSILIRPESRMPPVVSRWYSQTLSMFQSSSGPKAGCHTV